MDDKAHLFRIHGQLALHLPEGLFPPSVTELTIEKQGDAIVLRPVRPDWLSFGQEPLADSDFLRERHDVIVRRRNKD